MNRAGVWPCGDATTTTWRGFTAYVTAPAAKRYYIGIAGDNYVRIIVNDTLRLDVTNDANFQQWHIYPVNLREGPNKIQLVGSNLGGPALFGAEIYNNTPAEIAAAQNYEQLDLIFTTNEIRNINFQANVPLTAYCPGGFTIDSSGTPVRCRQLDIAGMPGLRINNVFNPYTEGVLGNWHPMQQYSYQERRGAPVGSDAIPGSTNIRRAGYFNSYIPLYYFTTQFEKNGGPNWVATNTVTLYNGKGTEVESRDVLNRYSSALFGYLESAPTAVASNAQYREIGFDGFEDYYFSLDCGADTCAKGHFDFRRSINGTGVALSNQAHSGKYSLRLAAGNTLTLDRPYAAEPGTALFEFDINGQYVLKSDALARDFFLCVRKIYTQPLGKR
ncbi:hypothetical protein [Paraflavitalea speifideaquila]|uniref:hypothetical protein n=1 Tax=Paraflavitalea speifideaquila TaxID=3076558 RepID=UPI0028EBE593|nr:hypothetical protein [Paraflavitalea speifideiaquila]